MSDSINVDNALRRTRELSDRMAKAEARTQGLQQLVLEMRENEKVLLKRFEQLVGMVDVLTETVHTQNKVITTMATKLMERNKS